MKTYLYLNNKGKYERMKNQKQKMFMFLFGFILLGLLMGFIYLMSCY